MKPPALLAALGLGAGGLAGLAAPPPAATIALNQLGYRPDGPRRAIVPSSSATPLPWAVRDARGRTVARGRTTVGAPDPALGYRPHVIDFTALTAAGTGYRVAAGGATSAPFAVAADVYRPLARDALAFFYHQRAGIPIAARFAGAAQWARPAGHPDERAPCFDGRDERGNVWPGCGYVLTVTGGWYDAGDHGKYVVNGGIAAWTLLNLYEWLGPRAFPDGAQPIPEAGNGIPDLLDEARWEVEFLLRMQVPAGSRQAVAVGQRDGGRPLRMTGIDTSGMAHHKVADARWTPLPTRPDRDPQPRLLYPPSTAATLNLAAVAAQCARVWRGIDRAFADRCLAAARRAWTAAARNPAVFAVGAFTGSGGYGDGDLADEAFWAAAELYATTGEARFRRAVAASPLFRRPIAGESGWAATAPLGLATLAIARNGLGTPEVARIRGLIVAAAAGFADEGRHAPYLIPYAGDRYVWGSNGALLNRAMLLAMAARWTGAPRYRAAVIDTMDYILGRNPLGQSYVSGYGARPLLNPHHRFWARQLDAAYPPPPPGALSGGPNNADMSDPVAQRLKGGCAPQRCWADDINAYALNEVAINWNAPLVWVAADLAQPPAPAPAR